MVNERKCFDLRQRNPRVKIASMRVVVGAFRFARRPLHP